MSATRVIDDHLELANIGTNSHAQIDTHIAAADNYVKRDGSLALTSDWDIGDGRKILADEVRARDGDGLKLYDDGGKGIFVDDGGNVGINSTAPKGVFDVGSTPAALSPRAFNIHDDNVSGNARIALHGTEGKPFSPGLEITVDGHFNKRNLILLSEEGSNNFGMRFYTTGSSAIGERIRIRGNGNVGIGTSTPTAKLDINSDILRLRTAKTPASAGAAGNTGDICADANYFYRCVSTNSWKRAALNVW